MIKSPFAHVVGKYYRRVLKILFYSVGALALVLTLVFFLIQKNSKELDPSRMALIDEVGGNYLFRGNNPFVTKNGEKIFAYDALTSNFNSILKQQNRKLLQDYYLIDVSLLDLDEYSEIKKEEQFFSKNPRLGKLINTSTLSPSLLLTERQPHFKYPVGAIVQNYNLWITNLLNKIHLLALQKADLPVVLYVHCDSGRDRTGLITASYKMLFDNINLAEAKSQNVTDVGRSSRTLYDRAMRSYCLYVQKNYNKSDDYCI